ncbi:PIG-L deacetylase family protein [Jiangella mangrovi]|uniref:LmbE family N-acetylglucosaminyl deacetylase n=1 Tax=Jiangella mangrovi TaxID=1524084 RepID=A0A7W9LJP1_9ACTN|nr:PIG-L deacetylase family protein [Jiangella mangrovi]MBB5786224.1 LmbE family N-acetylglucosaminyl deacetylase [Jiangella mangrovi]
MRRARRAVRAARLRRWRRALRRRALDVTADSALRTALVVAPHPDDETLGCGGTVALKRLHGTRVRVLVVTDGRRSHTSAVISPDELAAIRADEARRATAALGLPADELVLLGVREDELSAHADAVADAVAAELRTGAFADVLVTSGWDWHEDHQLVSAAVRDAAERAGGTVRVLEFPVWSWVDGPADPRAALDGVRAGLVDVSGVLERKRAAVAEYRSQTTRLSGEDDWAVMDEALLGRFLGDAEIFVEPAADRAGAGR